MRGLTLRDVREEIVALLDESTKELQDGNSQTAVTMLLEAQFLLSDAIQNEMNRTECTPSLVPLADGCSEEAPRAAFKAGVTPARSHDNLGSPNRMCGRHWRVINRSRECVPAIPGPCSATGVTA